MEKLHELVEEGGFDVVVVDTPPSRNALDFLDAPRRLTHFLENRIFQALMTPTRVGLRFMGVAAHALLRTLSRVAGADIVSDAVAFFQAFEGMEEGFRLRAARVRELLVQPGTAFVLVASPRPDSIDEAIHFAGKLAESQRSAAALIVNRVQPRFASDDQLNSLAPHGGPAGHREGGAPGALADLVDNLAGYTLACDREEAAYAGLMAEVPRPPSTGCRCSTPTCTTSPAWASWPTCCSDRTGRDPRPMWPPVRGALTSRTCRPSSWPVTPPPCGPRSPPPPGTPTPPSSRPVPARR